MAVDYLGEFADSTTVGPVRIDFRTETPGEVLNLPLGAVEGAVVDFGLDASGRVYVLSTEDLVYIYR